MGGHVIFSHYQYFDELLDRAVGSGDDFWNTLQRVRLVASQSALVETFVWSAHVDKASVRVAAACQCGLL